MLLLCAPGLVQPLASLQHQRLGSSQLCLICFFCLFDMQQRELLFLIETWYFFP